MATDDQFISKWQSWAETIGSDVLTLYQSRRLFDEVTKLFQHNNVGLLRGPFWRWMAENWAWSTAMGIRRQSDRSGDAVSLVRLIEDIERHPSALTRTWFVERWVAEPPTDFSVRQAHAIFGQYAPAGAPHVVPELIQRDRESLEQAAERVSTVVSRRFAHSSRREAPEDVTLGEVNQALNEIGERFKVYARLLAQQRTVDLEPPLPRDWDKPFVMQLQPSPHAAPTAPLV